MKAFLSGHQPTLAPFGGLANYPPYLIEALVTRLEGEHHRLIAWQQQGAVAPLQAPALISLRNGERAVLASCKTEHVRYGIFIVRVLDGLKDSVS